MKNTSDTSLLSITLMTLLFMFSTHTQAALQSGVPLKTLVHSMSFVNIEVIVPEGTTKLTVSITQGSDELYLYLKYGSKVSGGTLSEINADADIRSADPITNVNISLTPSTSPALRAGTWYIAPLNLNDETTTFTVTATIEIAQTLPLPVQQIIYPAYPPKVFADVGDDPALIKPIAVGNIADGGETVSIGVKLETPSGPYDAYFALHAPKIVPNEIFMLSQEGNLYPASKKGLVKWKQSASGPIDEKPFGEFSASLLLGGNYNLYFLLTPTNSIDAFYFWGSSFTVPESVPDGSAGFFNGTLVVPNATIIYQGEVYEGSVPLAENGIAAITKDGNTYLYHPALGKAELSEYNSRRAVGYFMAGVTASEVATMRAKRTRSPRTVLNEASQRSASKTIAKAIDVGQVLNLGTGVDIELLDSNGWVKATNSRRRFSVVKTGQSNDDKYFLVPKSNLIPTETLDKLMGINQVIIGGLDGAISNLNTERSDIKANDKIETFAAFYRMAPAYFFFNGGWGPNQREAFEKDYDLTLLVNSVDLFYTILEFTRHTAKLVPYECFDIVSDSLFRQLQSSMVKAMTNDMEAKWQLDDIKVRGFFSSLAPCVSESAAAATGVGIPVAVLIEGYNTFWDIVSAGNWVIEDVVWENWIALTGGDNDAYDLANIGINDMVAYLSFDPSSTAHQEIIRNMEDGSSWIVPEYAGGYPHQILGMTPGGVVMSFWDGEPEKIVTTSNWGRGLQTDIGSVSELCEDRNFDPGRLDITDSGRLYFTASKCWKEETRYGEKTIYRDGIYTVMADGSGGGFVPIVLDQTELNYIGYDNIEVDALSVSGNGKVLVFSDYNDKTYKHHLYSVDSSGNNLRNLASSNQRIDTVQVNSSGDKVIFDYTTPDSKTVLYAVSTNSGNPYELPTEQGLELFTDSAAISPDGNWVACVGGNLTEENSKIGFALMRSDGSDYHWVDTGNSGIIPHSDLSLQFTRNSKTVVFSGADVTIPVDKRLNDIFAVNIDPDNPNLRNLFNHPETNNHINYPILR